MNDEDEDPYGIDALSIDLDEYLDDGKYTDAYELAYLYLKKALTLKIPIYVEAYAQWNMGRVIWNSYNHYLEVYKNAVGDEHQLIAEPPLSHWVTYLPYGHKAALRASTLIHESPMTDLLDYYVKESLVYKYVSAGRFDPHEIPERPEKLYPEFLRQTNIAQAKQDAYDYIGAIEVYDQILDWIDKVNQAGGNWECATRFRIAKAIMNGIHITGKMNAGDLGLGWKIFNDEGGVLHRLMDLLPRGQQQILLAERLSPNDPAIIKLKSGYKVMRLSGAFHYEDIED